MTAGMPCDDVLPPQAAGGLLDAVRAFRPPGLPNLPDDDAGSEPPAGLLDLPDAPPASPDAPQDAPQDAIQINAVRVEALQPVDVPDDDVPEAVVQPAEEPDEQQAGAAAYDLRPSGGPEARVRYPDGYTPVLPATVNPLALQDDIHVAAVLDKGKRRWTALEIGEQVCRVQELLTSGYRPNLIRQLLQKEYGMPTATAEARLRAARQQMVSDLNVYDRKEKVAQMVQQLEEVVQKAIKNGREANVIGALRLQADLLQLYTNRN